MLLTSFFFLIFCLGIFFLHSLFFSLVVEVFCIEQEQINRESRTDASLLQIENDEVIILVK